MSEIPYHSEEAQLARRQFRAARPQTINRLQVFCHVACMGIWRAVFEDQVSYLKECGLTPWCHVIGSEVDFNYVNARCPGSVWLGRDLDQYETPTLQAVWEWARLNNTPHNAVLYLHTKGVSQSWDMGKQAWRILMEESVVKPWKENLVLIETKDIVGWDWIDNPGMPHFCGNFWMARCDWISKLDSPIAYRKLGGPNIGGNPWDRMHAEMWIAHKRFCDIESLRHRNEAPYMGCRAVELLTPAELDRLHAFQKTIKEDCPPCPDSPCSFTEAFAPISHTDCQFGSDKISTHDYAAMYDCELGRFQGTTAKLLEIGVMSGASLIGWRRFLGKGATIVGVDLEVEGIRYRQEPTVQCDATDASTFSTLNHYGDFDVIVDDGSHRLDDVVKAFNLFWPKVRTGGIYIVEDIADIPAFQALFPNAEIHDVRQSRGRWDDVCAIFRKEP